MEEVAQRARAAARQLCQTPRASRDAVLRALAAALRDPARLADVLAANAADLEAAAASSGTDGDVPAPLRARLSLGGARGAAALAAGLDALASAADPAGVELLRRELADGLLLRRLSAPLGVLCVIFEARPEAVVQIAALALKSGNAVILKGGKEAARSCAALAALVRAAVAEAGAAAGAGVVAVPADAVQLVTSRADVAALLRCEADIDLVIPRGSAALVREVKAATRIPVLGHADGVCAVYVDAAADATRALTVTVDSKINYPAACNSAETLLVHEDVLDSVFPPLAAALLAAGVSLHCDDATFGRAEAARTATAAAAVAASGAASPAAAVLHACEADWTAEWLSLHMSVRAVRSTAEAVAWVNAHGSHHTDVIVTEDAAAAAAFLAGVDSAGVFHNASSRFADGFRYGFGAEVGISTSRIHARGPVGLDGLMTYKYSLQGHGHTVAQFAAPPGATSVDVAGVRLPALRFAHDEALAAAAKAQVT